MTEPTTQITTFAEMLIRGGVPRKPQYFTLLPDDELVASGLRTLAEFESDPRTAAILDHLAELKIREAEVDVQVFAAPGSYFGVMSEREMPLGRPVVYRDPPKGKRGVGKPAKLLIDGGEEATQVLDELGIMFDSWRACGARHPWGAEIVPCERWCDGDHKMTDNAECSTVLLRVAADQSQRHARNGWDICVERSRLFGAWKDPGARITLGTRSYIGSMTPRDALALADAFQLAAEVVATAELKDRP